MEHRWGRRIATNVEVQLFGYPASIGWGRLRDVSLSGGFIETKLALAPPSALRIATRNNQRFMEEPFSVEAIVIRHTPQGLGVEWVETASEAIATLMRDAADKHDFTYIERKREGHC